MLYDVFISYSRKDANIAEKICKVLDREGITYFIDRKGIEGGAEFLSRITSAIDNSEVLLFLASKNAYDSKYSIKEINYAIYARSAKVIPYIIDGSELPPTLKLLLSDLNWRTIKKCPIEPNLLQDIRNNLNHEVTPAKNEDKKRDLQWRKLWYCLPLVLVCIGIWICFQKGVFRTTHETAIQADREKVEQDTALFSPLSIEAPLSQTTNEQSNIEPIGSVSHRTSDEDRTVEIPRSKESRPATKDNPPSQKGSGSKETPAGASLPAESVVESSTAGAQQDEAMNSLVVEDLGLEQKDEHIVRRGVRINGLKKDKKELPPQGGSYKVTVTLVEGPVSKDAFQISRSVGDDWCSYSIDSVDDQSMVLDLQFPANNSRERREAYIFVFMDEEEAELHILQERARTAISENTWRQKLRRLLDKPDIDFNGDRYRGEKRGTARNGYGLQVWKDGTIFWGYWKNNAMLGRGIYIESVSHNIKGLTDCSICASYYIDGIRDGLTSCYDDYGVLIYDGPMDENQPTDVYPSPYPTQGVRFDYLTFASGAWYLGETLNGKMDGFGLYVDTDGKVWIGYFSKGQKEESSGGYI